MTKELWSFIGVQRRTRSNADEKVNLLIREIFDSIEKVLSIDLEDYSSIYQLIDEKRSKNDSQSYFWDWLDDIGLSKLQEILISNLPSADEEANDLLDYREMILQLDIGNQIVDSYFTSIADTITSIYDYIQTSSEQAATTEPPHSNKITGETIKYHDSDPKYHKKHRWVMNYNKSPAEKKQDFCYN